jgi:hypothetical protein
MRTITLPILRLWNSQPKLLALSQEGRMKVPQRSIDAINSVLGLGESVHQVVRPKNGFETRKVRLPGTPKQLLVAIADSAADLLSKDELRLVKQCENPPMHPLLLRHDQEPCSPLVFDGGMRKSLESCRSLPPYASSQISYRSG